MGEISSKISFKKDTFEWVFTMNKGEPIVLTEKQYDFYDVNRGDGTVVFKNFEINPSFVVSAIKQSADNLYEMYPCKECKASGLKVIFTETPVEGQPFPETTAKNEYCKICNGTGLSFNETI